MNKIVFVLTSNCLDLYTTMTRVAIASLKLTNKNIFIILVCDEETINSLLKHKEPILLEIDELIKIKTPNYDNFFRNRYIKTNIQNIINDKFLFLDSDIFITRNIENIFKLNGDIAMAKNHSQDIIKNQIPKNNKQILKTMKWDTLKNIYFNGGVILFNNTEESKIFCNNWHNNWLQSYNITNSYKDTPALNHASNKMNIEISILENIYNYQMKFSKNNIDYLEINNIAIWHYNFSADMIKCKFEEFVYNQHKKCSVSLYKSVENFMQTNF